MLSTKQSLTTKTDWLHDLRPVIGGTLALAVAMGIGRFAYTPLLPVMQSELHISSSFAGILASFNYIGYLVGALVAGWLPLKTSSSRIWTIRASLIGSAVTTGALAFTESHWSWSILRGFGGLFSALILVCSSSLVMDWLSRKRQTPRIGVFYAGVGIGISLTGMLVPWFVRLGNWQTGWFGLGIASCLLGAFAWFFLSGMQAPPSEDIRTEARSPSPPPFRLWGITAAYGLEGLGYIVMGTFVTAFFSHVSSSSWLGNVSWVLVGLSAAPSTWLWSYAAQTWGWRAATYAAYMIQAAGVILPVVFPNIGSAIIGSILFGGTFMGITTLALSIGRKCAPERSNKVIGNMTAMFSIGQVLGPIGAGVLANALHSYNVSLLLSGMLLVAATFLLWLSRTPTQLDD